MEKNCSICTQENLDEFLDKNYANVNPTRMCQPMGAVQALMGIKNAMPLIHGSQGCATYMRFQLIRHFREPIEVASTSLSEKTVIYGGEQNLLKALKNVSEKQNPDMVCVMSSCLTETIGEDMDLAIAKFKEANIGMDLPEMIAIPTPSYAGSHIEGYDKAIYSIVKHCAELAKGNNKFNFILGNVSPADTSEIKNLVNDLGSNGIYLTDCSETLDAPLDESTLELHEDGTTLEEIKDTANSLATIALAKHADSAAKFLEEKFDVLNISGPMPIGIKNTDTFVLNICNILGIDIPDKVLRDRGRLRDALVDAHAYNYRKEVAIYGDPDVVIGIARLVSEMGMIPKVLCTGIKSDIFRADLETLANDIGFKPLVLEDKDLSDLEKVLEINKVDLLIGSAYGASIAKKMNIPLYRLGFPIFDRIGSQRISVMAYTGGIKFVDSVTNMILDYYYDEEGYRIVEENNSLVPNDSELLNSEVYSK